MSPVSTPSATVKVAATPREHAVTPPATAVARDAVAERVIDPASALARVRTAADRYRAAAAEVEERRRARKAAMLDAKAVGASAHQIAEAAGITDQRTFWILTNALARVNHRPE